MLRKFSRNGTFKGFSTRGVYVDFGFPRDFFMEVKKSALLLRLAVEDLDGVLKDKQISVFS